ncbi:DUF7288 family protein [Archaeoglobus sp.]
MPPLLKGSSFTCGRGQIHTVEAVIASAIIFGSVFFALTYPHASGAGEFKTLQLKKTADDLLEVLSIENCSYNTTLTMWIREIKNGNENKVNDSFYNGISLPLLKNMSVATRLEIFEYDANHRPHLIYCNGTLECGNTPPNCVSSFRIVLVDNKFYEVRLVACYV